MTERDKTRERNLTALWTDMDKRDDKDEEKG